MARFAVGYERVCRAIMTAFIIHVAFIVHTLMGLVVVGLFPAVSASFATWRTWMVAEDRWWTCKETWTIFHRAWKADLRKANLAGWPQLVLWLVVIYDYYIANWCDASTLGYATSGLLLLIIVIYGLFSLTFWTVMANFDESILWCVKMTLQMLLCRPLCTVCILVSLVFIAAAWGTWPGIFVAFGLSPLVFASSGCVYYLARIPGMNVRDTDAWKARHQA